MPQMDMDHTTDAKTEVLNRLGDISGLQVFHNEVIVALYVRPERTASGIYLTDNIRDEDKYQGKVGLIVKMGAAAFDDTSGGWQWEGGVGLHDWVWFRPSNGFALTINDKNGLCRVLKDTSILGTLPRPDMIW